MSAYNMYYQTKATSTSKRRSSMSAVMQAKHEAAGHRAPAAAKASGISMYRQIKYRRANNSICIFCGIEKAAHISSANNASENNCKRRVNIIKAFLDKQRYSIMSHEAKMISWQRQSLAYFQRKTQKYSGSARMRCVKPAAGTAIIYS